MNTKKVAIFLVLAVALVWATASAFSSPMVDVGDGQIDTIGSTTTIDIILDEAPNGFSGYNLTLSLSNPSVAEIVSVSFPSWATLHTNSTPPADSVWIKAADLMDQVGAGATNVNLATITLRGDNLGASDIIATVTKMDDDGGYPIDPSIDPGYLVVGSLCGDVNSDDIVDMDDVTLLLEDVGNYAEYQIDEDVNCDGSVNMGDVILLLNHVNNPEKYKLDCCEET